MMKFTRKGTSNIAEKDKMIDILFDNLKKASICGQTNIDCHDICCQHVIMLETCIKLLMNHSPNSLDVLALTAELAEQTADFCAQIGGTAPITCANASWNTSQIIWKFLETGKVPFIQSKVGANIGIPHFGHSAHSGHSSKKHGGLSSEGSSQQEEFSDSELEEEQGAGRRKLKQKMANKLSKFPIVRSALH